MKKVKRIKSRLRNEIFNQRIQIRPLSPLKRDFITESFPHQRWIYPGRTTDLAVKSTSSCDVLFHCLPGTKKMPVKAWTS